MLPSHLYNLYIFTELNFTQLQLIYIRNKPAVSIRYIYPLYTPNIYLQYIGFRNYLYIINPSRK
jgi:hypothetical protein